MNRVGVQVRRDIVQLEHACLPNGVSWAVSPLGLVAGLCVRLRGTIGWAPVVVPPEARAARLAVEILGHMGRETALKLMFATREKRVDALAAKITHGEVDGYVFDLPFDNIEQPFVVALEVDPGADAEVIVRAAWLEFFG